MSGSILRKDLFDLVQRMPGDAATSQLGIDVDELRYACKHSGIPLPKDDHWVLSEAERTAARPRLPPRPPGVRERIQWGTHQLIDEDDADEPYEPEFEPIERVTQRVRELLDQHRIDPPDPVLHPVAAAARLDAIRAGWAPSSADWPEASHDPESRRFEILDFVLTRREARCAGTRQLRRSLAELHDGAAGHRRSNGKAGRPEISWPRSSVRRAPR